MFNAKVGLWYLLFYKSIAIKYSGCKNKGNENNASEMSGKINTGNRVSQ